MVDAKVETDWVKAAVEEDSADDPAIWVSRNDSSLGVVMGTNKKAGIHVYNLEGKEIQFLKIGLVNNMDVRYGFPLVDRSIDIAAASNRTYQSIDVFEIDQLHGKLSQITRFGVTHEIDEVYGFCLAKDSKTQRFYALVNGKNGVVQQWELTGSQGKIESKLVRTLHIPTQTEGMVADDLSGKLYVGEEATGIWEFDLSPESNDPGKIIDQSRPGINPVIVSDIEGLTIYYLNETEGYLIASSQGNHSYAVFDRQEPHSYLGSFSVGDTEFIDGVEETDGIDVINLPLGPEFPRGCFIAQDGYNLDKNGKPLPQNFKMVPWESIAQVLKLKTIETYSGWKE